MVLKLNIHIIMNYMFDAIKSFFYVQKETAVLHDRVYQAHGASSSPRPKFPFAAIGVKESHTPEPTATSQPHQGASVSSTPVTSTQPNTTTNPYSNMRMGGGVGMTGGYPTQLVPQPGQPSHTGSGGGYPAPITQPLGSQGSAIMQPSTETYMSSTMHGIMQPGVPQPGVSVASSRETTYPVDAPVTWNDPPLLAPKKVRIVANCKNCVHVCTVTVT